METADKISICGVTIAFLSLVTSLGAFYVSKSSADRLAESEKRNQAQQIILFNRPDDATVIQNLSRYPITEVRFMEIQSPPNEVSYQSASVVLPGCSQVEVSDNLLVPKPSPTISYTDTDGQRWIRTINSSPRPDTNPKGITMFSVESLPVTAIAGCDL